MTGDGQPELAETYVRFGPGVPVATAPTTDQATGIWHGVLDEAAAGEVEHEDPALAARRRNQRWILPLTVLILVVAMLIYYLWNRTVQDLSVRGASVRVTGTPSLSCGGTEHLSGVVLTDGGRGTFRYEWLRSDGTRTGPLTRAVSRGTRQATVVLDWSFEGYGSFDATATLRVLSPDTAAARASFTYRCDRP